LTICAARIEAALMTPYFDTSILLKTYIQEPGTAEALALLRNQPPPAPFSHLLELELRTGIRLKYGRGEITAAAMRGALHALETDLAAGVLVRPDYDLEGVFRYAETLSAKHAASAMVRSADIWHIAAALEAGCKVFASFDERQRNVAALCGLHVLPSGKGPNPDCSPP
jgi:predicted nucleic acid-binding protein